MVGRPSKYTPEMQEKADKYLTEGYIKLDHVVPSVKGLAEWLGVRTQTIYDWKKDEKKVRLIDTLDDIEKKQHNLTIGNALRGEFNSTISKLLLHNHGYSDKVQSEISGRDGGPISVEDVTEQDKAILERYGLKDGAGDD